ncbi:HIT family protein [Jongsikchunia kroppenstedtii]|uniref:HIT family protein n=1 Tax=Jongsikchunia kroppenstedtii TaxID=1121721 RepID=UPI0003735B26|nr:HIT family protein [Jongsikchunia kroppenstedtii]
MSNCVFCAIVDGSAPARIVYSDDDVVAFLDIRPIRPGHTLVIPREHHARLDTLPPELGGKMFAAAQRIGTAMQQAPVGSGRTIADGVNLALNDGRAAFQTVFHSHIHVVPRLRGDRISLAKGLVLRRDPDPDATADRLRAALEEVAGER